ncbi:ATP-binding cassette domain-containing protein [Paenibacillus chartarius]|uniref:ATP-binding cassette domain-containing protein n=1 Tax=Paenibacillus chartarius TaxID=747481 RepID=A0ABV6DU30_9BACL
MSIRLHQVIKTFQTAEHAYTALKGIDLSIETGEFVAIIGKSGSGKSTLINMMTGIDTPTSGTVTVEGIDITRLRRGQLAQWRGRRMGIIFQFFQLLPTLTLLENVMLPMDFCGMFTPKERRSRAYALLEQVDMAEHAHKMPAMISGGQQQRVAIARSLANDPPIIVADEPTGSLDSKTADSIFGLFARLVENGKTVVMVTHDNDLAKKVQRSIIVADGEIVNEYVLQALPNLDVDMLTHLHAVLQRLNYAPGEVIVRAGEEGDKAYIITKGKVNVYMPRPPGEDVHVATLEAGQYFGEIALMRGGPRTATVRASEHGAVELMALGKEAFGAVIGSSSLTRQEMDQVIRQRLEELSRMGAEGYDR